MKPGDLIRVAEQPPNLLPKIVGEVGYVEAVEGDYARIQTIRPDGGYGGTGSVPLSCLAPEGRNEWAEAKRRHDAMKASYRAEALAFSDKVNSKHRELAGRFGISVEDVKTIVGEVGSLYP